MNLPESIVAGTHNTEEGLARRLAQYRDLNTEEETICNYYDEIEYHPHKIGQYKLLIIIKSFYHIMSKSFYHIVNILK